MSQERHCLECGAVLMDDSQTCTDDFHELLYWELDHQLWDVHHLMVLCFNLQHPSLLSAEGLGGSIRLLAEFLEGDISPQTMRKQIGPLVDSARRREPITAREGRQGAYLHPIRWEYHVGDVVRAGRQCYYESVRRWASETLKSLHDSGNLP